MHVCVPPPAGRRAARARDGRRPSAHGRAPRPRSDRARRRWSTPRMQSAHGRARHVARSAASAACAPGRQADPWGAGSGGNTATSRSTLPGVTMLGGDAASRNGWRGPAHRQAAQAQRSTTSAGGPAETTAWIGSSGAGFGFGLHIDAHDPTTHATAVERHPHDRPDCDRRLGRVGNEVVERAIDRAHIRQDATDARRGVAQASASAAALRSAA